MEKSRFRTRSHKDPATVLRYLAITHTGSTGHCGRSAVASKPGTKKVSEHSSKDTLSRMPSVSLPHEKGHTVSTNADSLQPHDQVSQQLFVGFQLTRPLGTPPNTSVHCPKRKTGRAVGGRLA